MRFSELELLCLRRILLEHISYLDSRVEKYRRYSRGGYLEEYQKKQAMAEAELAAMRSVLGRLNEEFLLLQLRMDPGNCS